MSDALPGGLYVVPASEQGYPVVVLHPWWGLNGDVKDFCMDLADAGFAVLAPDLYDGRIATTIAEAEALSGALDGDRAKAQVADAVRGLGRLANRFFSTEAGGPYQRNSGVAVVGFSLGAFFALDVAAALPDLVRAVVLYYGTGPADCAAATSAPRRASEIWPPVGFWKFGSR
jgi:carboxymethylenebutenolidase